MCTYLKGRFTQLFLIRKRFPARIDIQFCIKICSQSFHWYSLEISRHRFQIHTVEKKKKKKWCQLLAQNGCRSVKKKKKSKIRTQQLPHRSKVDIFSVTGCSQVGFFPNAKNPRLQSIPTLWILDADCINVAADFTTFHWVWCVSAVQHGIHFFFLKSAVEKFSRVVN